MANLTITVDEEVLKRARIRALELGTSVNRLLRDALEAFAGVHRAREAALQDLLNLSRASGARRGTRTWTRDELHQR
jgi:plasmid stability protein